MIDKTPIEIIIADGCLMQQAKEKKGVTLVIDLPV
jgi:hypothetical protein